MRILSFIIWYFLLYVFGAFTSDDSPHGKDFKISCSTCHSSKGWTLDKEIYSYDHSSTKMALTGQHKEINCRLCHPTLVFSEAKAKTECVNCHTDVHSQSVGNFCDRCHTPDSWIVSNVTEIHQQSRFPLLGVHTMTECQKCHKSETLLRYDVLGVECYDCHRDNFQATTSPNHISANFSTDCQQCHHIFAYEWGGTGFNHNFFPLTLGHANVACSQCHTNNNFTAISTECYSCHQPDYESATNPVHTGGCFSTDCQQCHTTNPGWSPVNYQHTGNFPLTFGHADISCTQCHTNSNCSTISGDCYACHQPNYEAATNPVHTGGCFSTDCQQCHTTNPGWSPVNYQHTGNFPLTLGHANISCTQCHTNSNCSTISSDCYACHKPDYETAPYHNCISTSCTNCHTTNPSWTPVNFAHDSYFPISSGNHSGFACNQCHTNPANCSYSCIDCHDHNQSDMNNEHDEVSGYSWVSTACYSCHPQGQGEKSLQIHKRK